MPDRYHALYVVSDLHIGGRPGYEIFREAQALGWLAEHARQQAGPALPVGLVLNGDVVDLLSDGDLPFDPLGAADRIVGWLARGFFAPLTLALRAFVQTPGCRLIVVIGNHDIELCLPEVQSRLRDVLAQGDEAARGRVLFATDGTGYRCRVGQQGHARTVLCLHGEVADSWNVVDHEDLRMVVRALNAGTEPPEITLNSGTLMVQRLINPLKYDERWPFVDLLKPEQEAAVQIAMALAWDSDGGASKTARYAARLLSTQPSRLRDALRRWAGWLSDAGEGEARPEGWSSTEAGRRLMEELSAPDQLAQEPSAWEQDDAGAFLSGGAGDRSSLREKLRKRVSDKVWAIDEPEETSAWVAENVGRDVHYVVAGHTHLRRKLRPDGWPGLYFNSGTWISLMAVPDHVLDDDDAFDAWVAQLQRCGTTRELEEAGLLQPQRTVVVIDGRGESVDADLWEVRGPQDGPFELRRVAGGGR